MYRFKSETHRPQFLELYVDILGESINMKIRCCFPGGDLHFADQMFQEPTATWEDRVLSVSSLTRSISEKGSFEITAVSIQFDDTDRFFRDMMFGDNRYIAGKTVEILSDAGTSIYSGTIQKWEFGAGTFEIEVNDLLGGLECVLPENTIKTSEYIYLAADDEAVSTPINILYGNLETYRGAVKCWRVDEDVYLVADHPCHDLTAVFDPDGDQLTGWYLTEGSDGRAYVNAPSGAGTYIYICVNIQGKEIGGQYTDDPVDILADLLQNYTALNYSTVSFQAAQAIMKDRSYRCGLAIHQKVSIKTILSYFGLSFDCVWYINQQGEICLFIYDFQMAPVLTFDPGNIIHNSLRIQDNPDLIANQVKWMHLWDTGITDFRRKPIHEALSSGWGVFPDSIALRYTYDEATAFDVVQRYVIQRENPLRRISFLTTFDDFVGELSNVVTIDHPELVSQEPATAQIRRITFDFHRETVKIEAIDISLLGGSVAILGDENEIPESWQDADENERLYAYMADETTGMFSDGEPGKVLY